MDAGGGRIIKEYEDQGFLCTKTRRQLVNIVAKFIEDKYSLYPSREQKTMVSNAVVKLFPRYMIKDNITNCDGIVSNRFLIF